MTRRSRVSPVSSRYGPWRSLVQAAARTSRRGRRATRSRRSSGRPALRISWRRWSRRSTCSAPLSAAPVATAMLHQAAFRGRRLDAFVVRKEGKAHGLQRRIEGPDVAGKRVLAVEDTSTTGGSVMTAVEALRSAGAEVVAVAVIVERGAADAVAAAGLPYLTAYSLADLGLG